MMSQSSQWEIDHALELVKATSSALAKTKAKMKEGNTASESKQSVDF